MVDTDNPYEAPESDLVEKEGGVGGSLESALVGDYDFVISDVLKSAWDDTDGFKLTVWGAILISVLANLVMTLLQLPFAGSVVVAIIIQILAVFVVYPLNAGMVMLGVYNAAERPVQASQILGYYNRALKIVGLQLVMIIMIAIGLVLLVLPGIYLAIAYTLAMPLMLEKNVGIWEALETSRKAITKKWFSFFGMYLLLMVIFIVASIPLGIGLIWAVPLAIATVGTAYKTVFGVLPE